MPLKHRRMWILAILPYVFSACADGALQREAASLPPWCAQIPRAGNLRLPRVAVSSDWFEVYDVAPGVYAVYEPYQFEEVISYLVTGPERALLFDTGLGMASIRSVVTELTTLPVTVLNSHTHPDHIGGNAEFEHVVAVGMDFTVENSAGMEHERVAGMLAADAFCRLPAEFDSAAYEIPPFEIDETVRDGEVIDLGGRSIEIILTPGHAPDALMALDRQNGLLFTGDSFYEGPIYVMTEASDFAAYRESIGRIRNLVPALRAVLPGHNVVRSDPELIASLWRAVESIASGTASPSESTDGVTRYSFDAFAILVPDSIGRRSVR